MPLPRSQLISMEQTPVYHVISRCVRRQFLCGKDASTGKDFSHRRDAIRSRLAKLVTIFAIDVCAYAIMSNHTHIVLWVDQQRAFEWSDLEVAERWTQLFAGPAVMQSFVAGHDLSEAQRGAVGTHVTRYRQRLFDISWFMKCLNEPIAREANREDGVTGHFWEGRFKSQALLDEAAIVSAMAYVDLNPVRAGMAETPEKSDFTSIQQRLRLFNRTKQEEPRAAPANLEAELGRLMPFADGGEADPERSIPIELQDYLELVDWTGRAVIEGKKGAIPAHLPPILERLKLEPSRYLKFISRHERGFLTAIGAAERMREFAEAVGKSFLKGQTAAAAMFSPGR